MLKLNDIITIDAEKLTYGGDCIGRWGENKFVVFIKNAVVGDKLKVKITSLNKTYAKAEIVEVINPSQKRTKAPCPIYNACGSCQLQNYDYDFLIEQKQKILEDIFKGFEIKIFPFIKSPKISEYRCKIQYPVRQTKNSKRILMGYFKNNSHELTNIKFCPMQPNIIDEITQYIRDNWILDCYDEKNNKGFLKNVIFRINSSLDSILIVFVLNTNNEKFKKSETETFFKKLIKTYPVIKGIFVNFNDRKSNSILGKTTEKIIGEDFIIETLDTKKYKIGATSFFQVNPYCVELLFDKIKENIKPDSSILDAYGGVGAIGIYLKEKAKSITLIEENEEATKLALENFKLNNIKNYEILTGDAKKHFLNFEKENKKFDYIILDPPRSGCNKEGLKAISATANNIIYVSCNPETLRRDILYLKEENFELISIQGADMFPYTYHIETVAILKRKT